MQSDFSPVSFVHDHCGSAAGSAAGRSIDLQRSIDLDKIAAGIRTVLEGLGENLEREGLRDTPERVARMYAELICPTEVDPARQISCTFHEPEDNLVLVKDINFASICEHHLLPFVGVAHLAYVPNNGRITGLSKLARVVEVASKRLQMQERMTVEIADALVQGLKPAGVLVVLEAEHYCMTLRGVKKAGSKTVTSAARGSLAGASALRREIFMHLGRS